MALHHRRRFAVANGKPDAVTEGIAEALRFSGFYVVLLGGVGKGVPDLLVGKGKRTWLLEVKTPKKRAPPRLRESQEDFRRLWPGCPVEVVTSPEEALRAVGIRLRSAP
jgi:hypothetical protein